MEWLVRSVGNITRVGRASVFHECQEICCGVLVRIVETHRTITFFPTSPITVTFFKQQIFYAFFTDFLYVLGNRDDEGKSFMRECIC